jgi:hypothetical protein
MASLALLVALIFLTIILLPVITLLFSYFKFKILTILSSVLSFFVTINWVVVSPIGVKWIGVVGFLLTIYSLKNLKK